MLSFEWDEDKRLINLCKHNVDFAVAHRLWRHPMVISEYRRRNYGETRYQGYGLLKNRVMMVVFTFRGKNNVRLISLRKANRREQKIYEKEIARKKNCQIYS